MDVALDGDGGWVYQKANATLPADFGKPTSIAIDSLVPEALVNGSGAHSILSQFTNETTTISTERPIEILHMSPLAVGLCLGILIWLIGTCVLILILKKRYFLPLLGKVESVADVAVLVAGSERLLSFAGEKGPIALQADKTFKTRLGWFRTSTGEVRWGIELVEPGFEFLTEAEAHISYCLVNQMSKVCQRDPQRCRTQISTQFMLIANPKQAT